MPRKGGVREKILDVALNLFLKKPYGKVSIDDIAKSAGVSKGAVFHYFKSKLDLAEKALEKFFLSVVAIPLKRILESDASFEDKVGRVVSLSLSVSLNSNFKSMLFLTNIYEELRSRGRGGFVEKIYEEFVEVFASFFEENGVRNPRVKARLFMAVLDGLGLQCMISPETFRDPEVVDAIKREVVCMLRC